MNVEHADWNGEEMLADDERAKAAGRRRVLVWTAAILVVVILAISAWAMNRTPTAKPVKSVPTVTYVVPGRSAVAATVSATGTLSAKREMPVGVAGEGGMINRVLVDAGDWVRAGQVMATVDPAVQAATTAQTQASIASAVANAKLAQSQLDRAQALVSRGFISKADIDQRTATRDAANASVRVAQAQYREQAARLGRLDIRAPASGFVLARNVEPGQIVSSGSQALFLVAMDGTMEMRAKLAEQDLANIHVGMVVQVTPIGANQSLSGTVWQVSPMIDSTSRQGEARVQLSYAPALRPGGFASASFSSNSSTAPVLPESAVLSDAHGNYVFVINGQNHVERRDVKIGDVSDTGIAILQGLSGNEEVVYSAGAFLNAGDEVVPARRGVG